MYRPIAYCNEHDDPQNLVARLKFDTNKQLSNACYVLVERRSTYCTNVKNVQ